MTKSKWWGWCWLVALAVLLAAACSEIENEEFNSDRYGDVEASLLLSVAAGDFTMGSDYSDLIDLIDGTVDEGFADEQPERSVYVSSFEIEQTEVTNAQYRACVGAGACVDPKEININGSADYYTRADYDNYPMVNVTWQMAADYCAWRGRRLPTEAEWEKAARGAADDRIFPWGWLEPNCEMANLSVQAAVENEEGDYDIVETCHQFPVLVSYYAASASPFGLLNVTGNVAEWVADYYAADYYDRDVWPDNANDPTGPEEGTERVIRGGGYTSGAIFGRVSYRDHHTPDFYDEATGFRCAR